MNIFWHLIIQYNSPYTHTYSNSPITYFVSITYCWKFYGYTILTTWFTFKIFLKKTIAKYKLQGWWNLSMGFTTIINLTFLNLFLQFKIGWDTTMDDEAIPFSHSYLVDRSGLMHLLTWWGFLIVMFPSLCGIVCFKLWRLPWAVQYFHVPNP